MAGGYIQLPLIGDVETLTQTGRDYMTSSMGPNWTMRPANPETVLIEGSGQIAGELLDQAATVPPEALAYIGTSLYGIPMDMGARAAMTATITFEADAAPSMVPRDSEVSVPHPTGEGFIFTTDRDAVAPELGGDVVVNLVALDVGADANGAVGPADLVDVVEGVSSVVAGLASGGTDPEEVSDYLNRLTAYLAVPRRPVRPEDFVALALGVPGVGRVAVFNLYFPGTDAEASGEAIGDFDLWTPLPAPAAPQTDVARCTTLAITNDDGGPPSLPLMEAVYTVMDINREVNFLNFVMKPTFTGIDLRATVHPYSGFTQADAVAAAAAMAESWLSTEWNTTPGVTGNVWNSDTKVRLYEAVDWLNRGSGVWYVEDVEMKLSSEAGTEWRAEDIDLPGMAPIPTAGTIEIT